MVHYHVRITKDLRDTTGGLERRYGALCTTEQAARTELNIELFKSDGTRTGRQGEVETCRSECFGRSKV